MKNLLLLLVLLGVGIPNSYGLKIQYFPSSDIYYFIPENDKEKELINSWINEKKQALSYTV